MERAEPVWLDEIRLADVREVVDGKGPRRSAGAISRVVWRGRRRGRPPRAWLEAPAHSRMIRPPDRPLVRCSPSVGVSGWRVAWEVVERSGNRWSGGVGSGTAGTPSRRRTSDLRHGISGTTFYKWKAKFGGMDVSDARKLKALEEENRRLKKLLAEQVLDNAALKDLVGKNF